MEPAPSPSPVTRHRQAERERGFLQSLSSALDPEIEQLLSTFAGAEAGLADAVRIHLEVYRQARVCPWDWLEGEPLGRRREGPFAATQEGGHPAGGLGEEAERIPL